MVKASTETVLAALTANGLSNPNMTAFDGQRILVTNAQSAESVSLWKAPDLTPLGSFSTGPGSNPGSVCSDGVNFWVVLWGTNHLARF